jgi:hypothetical protein
MRHYYDIYELLQRSDIQAFIGTADYKAHKAKRFPKADNQNIAENQAFIIDDPETWKRYENATRTAAPFTMETIRHLGRF